ncbi:hypothetical protein EVAR_57353_1 [Eumeta japonica]|uniref:115 kDa protein in type-1 retrotransposable element R1DM n=1 Tax=Eumeta variegata TaxID=151549 RepID=A0A4C1ZGG3_EUMVA|nr:hypothetical protein EVAR_57353_1 [Eumeta japonica]
MPKNVINSIKFNGKIAGSVDDGIGFMLHSLLSNDDTSSDTVYYRKVKIASTALPGGWSAPPISMRCLEEIVRRLPNTSLILDGITAKIVREAWKVAAAEITMMYIKCIVEAKFPDVWKVGRLIVLPKGRQIGLRVGGRAGWKASTLGCPHGSVMGPSLWKLLLVDVFRLPKPMPMPMGCRLFAYTDNITAVMEG